MTDLSIHQKNISTYSTCESLIKNVIEDLYLCKEEGIRTPSNESVDGVLDRYYGHLERIRQLKSAYLKQNNLTLK